VQIVTVCVIYVIFSYCLTNINRQVKIPTVDNVANNYNISKTVVGVYITKKG